MVWSGAPEDFEKAVMKANAQIEHFEANLPDRVVEDCQGIADHCYDSLETVATNEHPRPYPTSTPSVQADNLVNGAIKSSLETPGLDAFRQQEYEYNLDDTQAESAEQLIGLLILKNGLESSNGGRLPERVQHLLPGRS